MMRLSALLAMILLTACAPEPINPTSGNRLVVGETLVIWEITQRAPAPEKDTLTFTFAAARPPTNGVTEADWQAEAAAREIPADALKQQWNSNAFRAADGSLAPCDLAAQVAGVCGQRAALTKADQLDIARRILAERSTCRDATFDPAYNERRADGRTDLLFLKAQC